MPGYNVRPTEFQAVLGLEQLKKINSNLNKRDQIIKKIKNILIDSPDWLKIIGEEFVNKKINKKNNRNHSWMMIPLLIKNKKLNFLKITDIFEKHGIETRPIISGNILKHPVFKKIKYKKQKN